MMQIILTDVTYMSGTHICIAGMDIAGNRMVRPLLANRHWTTRQLGQQGFTTGAVVDFNPANHNLTGNNPHLTEDMAVAANYQVVRQMTDAQIHGHTNGGLTQDLDLYFQFDNPQSPKRYVADGKSVPSLGGIVVTPDAVRFYETSWNKLRCTFSTANGQTYDFPVTSISLRDIWKANGIAALRTHVAGHDDVELRIGLARGWSPSGGALLCYAQLNNMLLL